jgi:RND family efflux transporter MFP subunit
MLLFSGAALVLAGGGWMAFRGKGVPVPAGADSRTVEVRTGPLRQTVREIGQLQPVEWVDVKSEISGRISQILAEVGTPVKSGQVLVRLDDRILLKQLDQARIKVELARLTEDKQRRTLARRTQLFEDGRGVIAAEELDQARTDYDLAVVSRRDAENAVQTVEEQLQHTTIVSVLDGLVIERGVNPGDVVIGSASAGAPTALMRVANVARMRVVVEVNEVDYPDVAVGQPVEVHPVALVGKVFRGAVVAVGLSGHADAKNKNLITYQVKAEVQDFSGSLRSAMTATVDIVTREKAEALLIPREAVLKQDGATRVIRVLDGQEETVDIKTGLEGETEVEVLEGLQAGDRVKLGAWTEADWEVFRKDQQDRRSTSKARRGGSHLF